MHRRCAGFDRYQLNQYSGSYHPGGGGNGNSTTLPELSALTQRLEYFLTAATGHGLAEPGLLLLDRRAALVAEHAVDFADVVAAGRQQTLQFAAFGA